MAVGEVLAEADGLAVGDAFLVGVGLTDFTGSGLILGLDEVVGCTATTLGVGEDVGRGCWLTMRDGVTLGEFECAAVLSPVLPLA